MKAKKLLLAWIEALESGNYKQTRNELTKNNAYCCLGVLCEIARKQFKLKPLLDGKGHKIGYITADQEEVTTIPPTELQDFLSLTDRFAGQSITNILVGMNDDEKRRFPTIAKFLRETVLPKFE